MLYLAKQDKNIATNNENGDNRLPYFKLLEVEETTDENGEKKVDWKEAKELMVFWKSKSGKGYNGKRSEPREVPKEKKVDIKPITKIDYPEENINPDDIPF